MHRMPGYLAVACLLAVILLLNGCEDSSQATLAPAEPIAPGDICHVCGMTIDAQPGPKGEAFMGRDARTLKFCSTAELLTFLRQPENKARFSHAYVHDMSNTGWDNPDDDAFIRAADAIYVIGHDRRGNMGHTLAPFADKNAAEAFVADHGGELIAFDDITLERLAQPIP